MTVRSRYLIFAAALTPLVALIALGLTPDLPLFGVPADFSRGLMVGAVIGGQLVLALRAVRAR